jgi:hypothetical protein
MVESNETTTDRIVGPYPPEAARSMLSRRTELLVGKGPAIAAIPSLTSIESRLCYGCQLW